MRRKQVVKKDEGEEGKRERMRKGERKDNNRLYT